MNFACCNSFRRSEVKAHPTLNGIDFLEVDDNPNDPLEKRQTILYVHFIKDIVPASLKKENVIITGGERITDINVVSIDIGFIASPPDSPMQIDAPKILVVQVDTAGDFSTYTLRLIQIDGSSSPPDGYDPVLASVDFSFKVLCESDFDCQAEQNCPDEPLESPDINYLAKDYATFRQLILDRMSLLSPEWLERNPADLGITMVELLAYVGDYMSYRQDAIATEAYLGTARRRISVRRHARLVDYYMHDGCNSRTFVHIEIDNDASGALLEREPVNTVTRLLTRLDNLPNVISPDSQDYRQALTEDIQIFEPLHDQLLYSEHNEIELYTWQQGQCILPKGSTSATLAGSYPNLQVGDVLIFVEKRGPQTGEEGDADPSHRQAVLLTSVQPSVDPIGNTSPASPPSSPPGTTTDGIPITEIEWGVADALLFPLCISSGKENDQSDNVSVALGNNVCVDNGLTVNETLPIEPEIDVTSVPYRPILSYGPLTQAAPYSSPASASAAMQWSMRDVLPDIQLMEAGSVDPWSPLRDLLNSAHNDKSFVAEVETDGIAQLRFGDGEQGQRPESGTELTAVYRVGNGISGNTGPMAIAHMVTNNTELTRSGAVLNIYNPLAAIGGIEQESIESVRQRAPYEFRTQERAVTLADYEVMSQRVSNKVQRSAASFRWTGSWRTVFLTVDQLGTETIDADFETSIRDGMEQYRMAGIDLEVDGPVYVSLEIHMTVCVQPDYFANDVEQALLNVFSNKVLPDGQKGIFHPDNFSFGQTVYLSPIYAAAQKMAGVTSVQITMFQRQRQSGIDNTALLAGKLLLGRLEIAQLDNDPNFPEHGVFVLNMQGGR